MTEYHVKIINESTGQNMSLEDLQGDAYSVEVLLKDTPLQCRTMEYEDEIIIGIPYTQMDDNETLSEFKTRVKEEIEKALKVKTDVFHIEEVWANY